MIPQRPPAPAGAPPCWGAQYQDGDQECAQCPFRDTCKSEIFRRMASAPSPPVQGAQGQVPLPARVFPMTQAPTPIPPPKPVAVPVYQPPPPPPVPLYQQPTYQTYQAVAQTQQVPPGHLLPLGAPPNPMMAWSRPGTNQPYYFCQFPGETIPQRLAKNMTLRAGESIFSELALFFRHWTWPPGT